jgi:hypothetical protein
MGAIEGQWLNLLEKLIQNVKWWISRLLWSMNTILPPSK